MPITKAALENHQSALYFCAVAAGCLTATFVPGTTAWSQAINPALAFMLLATFLQVPLATLARALRSPRFIGALCVANFVAIPALVLVMKPWLPDAPLVQFGILLVLLAPCIDYAVTFCHLGRGDSPRLLSCTPLLLLLQLVLLPIYLTGLLDDRAAALIDPAPFAEAFVWLILIPLITAGVLQRLQGRVVRVKQLVDGAGWLTVPATALVIFLVVAAVIPQMTQALIPVRQALPFYLLFAVAAPLIGGLIARGFALDAAGRRAVAFSCATRNSLVILPLALSIPGAMPVLPAILVTQTLIELIAESIYVRVIPRWIADRRPSRR